MKLQSATGLLVLMTLLAGCGGTGAPAAPAAKKASTKAATNVAPKPAAAKAAPRVKVDLRLPYLISGYDAPFYLAKADGAYRKAGLDVTIKAGRGSSTTGATVANGSDTFGFADAGTIAELISKGAPLKSVAVIVQKTPDGIIYGPKTTLKTGADLKGKTLITAAGSATIHLVTAVLQKAHLTKRDVKIDFVAPAEQAQNFKVHPNYLLLGVSLATYVNVLQIFPQAKFISFADLGVNPYSFSLITNTKELKAHPKVVREFVAASLKGWQAALANPKLAVQTIEEADPKVKSSTFARSLKLTMPLLHTPATKGKPLGWTPASGWRSTLNVLHTYGGMKTVKPLSDYYTNAFLPKS